MGRSYVEIFYPSIIPKSKGREQHECPEYNTKRSQGENGYLSG